MRYTLKRNNGTIVAGIGWNSKIEAEKWIREDIEIHGGLDWRVGALFKSTNNEALEVVWSRTHKSVNWYGVGEKLDASLQA